MFVVRVDKRLGHHVRFYGTSGFATTNIRIVLALDVTGKVSYSNDRLEFPLPWSCIKSLPGGNTLQQPT